MGSPTINDDDTFSENALCLCSQKFDQIFIAAVDNQEQFKSLSSPWTLMRGDNVPNT